MSSGKVSQLNMCKLTFLVDYFENTVFLPGNPPAKDKMIVAVINFQTYFIVSQITE